MYAIGYIMNVNLRTPADFGALIRERRQLLGLNQFELANLAGVSRLWVSQVESGKPGASLGLMLRALAAVGVDLTGHTGEKSSGAARPETQGVVSPDIDAIIARARNRGAP